jgi:hypothetical protein
MVVAATISERPFSRIVLSLAEREGLHEWHYRTALDYLLISGILRLTLVEVVNSRILNNLWGG